MSISYAKVEEQDQVSVQLRRFQLLATRTVEQWH